MRYPIKYIENNLVFNHDGECFVYYRSEEHTSELQSRGHLVCRRSISTLFPYTTLFRSYSFLKSALTYWFRPKVTYAGKPIKLQHVKVNENLTAVRSEIHALSD